MGGRKRRPFVDDVDDDGDDGLADAAVRVAAFVWIDSDHIGLSRLIPTQLDHYFDDGWVVNVNVWWSSTLASLLDLSAPSLVSIRVSVPLESWVVHYLVKQYTRIVNKLEPDIYRRVDNDIIRSLVHVYHSGSEFIKALTR